MGLWCSDLAAQTDPGYAGGAGLPGTVNSRIHALSSRLTSAYTLRMNRLPFFALMLVLAQAGTAQTPDKDRLEQIQKEREQAEAQDSKLAKEQTAVKAELEDLQSQLVRVGSEVEGLEITARSLSTKLMELEARENALSEDIYRDRQSLMRLLAALQRVENNPPPALAVSPEDAANAARAARLMASLSEDLNARAQALSKRLAELGEVRNTINLEQAEIAANQEKLSSRRDRIRKFISSKSSLETKLSKDRARNQERVADLASEADSLLELIRKLEETASTIQPRLKPGLPTARSNDEIVPRIKPKDSAPLPPVTLPPDTLRFADARDALKAPVNGIISQAYSAQNKGITVATESGSQVVAPYSGRIEFAGPFKNYEKVVIMNVGGGYFLLMTGLGELYAESGSMVSIGEPVGLMPFNTNNKADLYIEIRKNGSPVNPNPWLGTAFARQG